MTALLTLADLTRSLDSLPGWAVEGGEIVKTFAFPTYLAGADFITRVAHESETMNHHPDLLLLWRKVIVRLCTHSSGGITGLDIALAMKIEQLAGVGGK